MHLRGDHHLVAPCEILERAADDLLARAVGIDIGGIEECDAELQRSLDEGAALLLVEGPRLVAAIRDP
jgi:hypothetical protein